MQTKTAITAIGIANPPYQQKQMVAAEMVAEMLQLKPLEKRLLKSVYRSTGIEHRYSVLNDFCKRPGEYEFFSNDPNMPFPSTAQRMRIYKENALPLAIKAIEDCFKNLNQFNPKTITHVVTISCTGMYAPGIDIEIIEHFKLNSDTQRTTINFMGCYGAFNGLKMADTICKADANAKVLVVSVELCTLHFQKNESRDSIFSNAIFADGAAAVLIEGQHQRSKSFSFEKFHCDLLPQNSKDMAWEIGDSGFDIVLSSYIPQAIETGIANFTQRLLDKNKMAFSDIDLFAIHPGGAKILKACETAFSITEEDNRYSYQTLRDYGNMSSATVLFVLKKIWDDLSAAQDDKTIFSCAFGPGLTLESMLLKIKNN